ncbi:hypothetical protein SESBI_00880 [Sesbania bispinosa]|nr:hypothetical protein SESBI_00880 [Sesbania bispinosa]
MKHARSRSGKRDTMSRSSTSSARSRIRYCRCREELIVLTSKTPTNPGRDLEMQKLGDEAMSGDDGLAEEFKRLNAEVEELKRKNGKLSKKLTDERMKGRMCIVLLIVNWVVTVGLCLVFSFKCDCPA